MDAWALALPGRAASPDPLGYALGIRGGMGAVGMWVGIASGLALAAVLLPWRFARLTLPR